MSCGVSISSLATIIDGRVGIASRSISLVYVSVIELCKTEAAKGLESMKIIK